MSHPGQGHAAWFTDLDAEDNSFNGLVGYPAASGYDMATALGTPLAVWLMPVLCRPAGQLR